MTTDQTPIPEPTSPTEVVVGKRNGETVVAVQLDNTPTPWALQSTSSSDWDWEWYDWDKLCDKLTDIRVEDMAEVADKSKPGPWLTADELKAILPTLKVGDVVEVDFRGHTATGKLWEGVGTLWMCGSIVRYARGSVGLNVDALRIIERAPEPEPGADIPDGVVTAAWSAYANGPETGMAAMRAALAVADAKRAELEVQA